MKKLFALLIAALFVASLGLTGCGGTAKDKKDAVKDKPAPAVDAAKDAPAKDAPTPDAAPKP